jgi:hypothetical protein
MKYFQYMNMDFIFIKYFYWLNDTVLIDYQV